MRAPPLLALLAGLSLIMGGCSGGSQKGPPQPSGLGTPKGQPVMLLVDAAAGGQVVATDLAGTATATLTVPPGALVVSTEITITEIGNTAPGGVGSAWRVGPEGLQLLAPVTLAFKPGVPVDALGVSTQAPGGFWTRRRDVVRDAVAGTVSVTTDHLSDWAVAAGGSARDLQGVVTLSGTVDVPATVSGAVTLDYAGDLDGTSYYILGGTLGVPATIADGAATCTPDQLAFAVRANLAELRLSPARFRWGTSGAWPLSCTGPGGAFSETLLSAFDNMGIGYPGCTRTDQVAPVATPDLISGQYLIDCGTRGTVTATWTFVTCVAGTACTPTTPCRTGALSCATALPSCAETGNLADGAACGTQPGDACQAGTCVICSPTASCTPADPCRTGTVACTTSPASCVASGNMPDGTNCGLQAGDQCLAGACSVCVAGAACGAPNVCQTAATNCSTAPASCTIASKPDGTSCGPQPGDQCLAGACLVCTPGAACGAPTVCQTAATNCTTAPATCDIAPKPDGTSCGPQPGDICVAGACSVCTPGAACSAPTVCQTAATNCTTAPASCDIAPKPDGTSCGPQPGDICVAGACSVCAPGAACGAPTVCQTAATNCSTAPASCDIAPKPDGTSCGPQPGDICVAGACSVCTPGAACGAPTVCQTAATNCSTAPASCTIAPKPDGTSCGPQPGDVCLGGACSVCTPGAACGAPTVCQTAATNCTTAPASCDIASKPDGTSCGPQPGDVCLGGACSVCTPGAACGAPTVCQTAATNCTTAPASCDIASKPDGTSCGPQPGDVCLGGACSVCTPGAACGAPTVCQTAATDCSTFPATCTVASKPDGTSCGPQPADACSAGACVLCVPGAACGAPTECQTSSANCGTSPATCTILNKPDSTPCSIGLCTAGVCG